MSLLIKNVRVVNPFSTAQGDILVEDGKITGVGDEVRGASADEVLEGEGLCAIPGIVDIHVHLRDPGQTHKEDIASGCAAAAAGGVTSLVCMPNTVPTVDSPEIVKYILNRAAETGVNVYPAAAITYGISGGGCCDYEALKAAGAKALSDDGRPVENDEMLEFALNKGSELGLQLLCHCEDLKLAAGGKMHDGEISRKLGVKGMPSASEYGDIERTVLLAEKCGASVHICHVSTRESIEIIRQAKKRGVKVTCETAPHYFAFTEEKLLGRDADYRMNPPLRTEDDRQAVIQGLLDGTIDAIATDHAPHSQEEKSDFVSAPNGVIGMETSLSASMTYLGEFMSLNRIIQLMSYNPAGIIGANAGEIKAGMPADFALVAPDEKWVVDVDRLHGKSKNAVFKGVELTGRVKATYCSGRRIY